VPSFHIDALIPSLRNTSGKYVILSLFSDYLFDPIFRSSYQFCVSGKEIMLHATYLPDLLNGCFLVTTDWLQPVFPLRMLTWEKFHFGDRPLIELNGFTGNLSSLILHSDFTPADPKNVYRTVVADDIQIISFTPIRKYSTFVYLCVRFFSAYRSLHKIRTCFWTVPFFHLPL